MSYSPLADAESILKHHLDASARYKAKYEHIQNLVAVAGLNLKFGLAPAEIAVQYLIKYPDPGTDEEIIMRLTHTILPPYIMLLDELKRAVEYNFIKSGLSNFGLDLKEVMATIITDGKGDISAKRDEYPNDLTTFILEGILYNAKSDTDISAGYSCICEFLEALAPYVWARIDLEEMPAKR